LCVNIQIFKTDRPSLSPCDRHRSLCHDW